MALSTMIKNEGSSTFPHDVAHIAFTDAPAPLGVETRDMSQAQDGGVVGWRENDTYYVSTQREGVKITAPADCSYLFYGVGAESINAAMLDTSNTTNMNHMFANCEHLKNVDDLFHWDTHNVTTMDWAFCNCTSLENIDGLSRWDVSNVTSMISEFSLCDSLRDVDALALWDTSAVSYMCYMFMDCESLANIDGLAGWDTSAVETMDSMFQDCQALTNVDALTDWNTHNVKSMNTMFNHCSSLSDVYGLVDWDTSSVKSMGAIFADCLHLPPSRYIEAFQTKQAAPTTQPTAKPYIPKSQTTDKTRDAEPER